MHYDLQLAKTKTKKHKSSNSAEFDDFRHGAGAESGLFQEIQ